MADEIFRELQDKFRSDDIVRPKPDELVETHSEATTTPVWVNEMSGGTTFNAMKALISVSPLLDPDPNDAEDMGAASAGMFKKDVLLPNTGVPQEQPSQCVQDVLAATPHGTRFVYVFRSTDGGTTFPGIHTTVQTCVLYLEIQDYLT